MSGHWYDSEGVCKMCGLMPGAGCKDDWPTTTEKYARLFRGKSTSSADLARRWKLSGKNMLTNEVLGFVVVKGELVEVSTSIGICGDRIFGVTWNRANDAPVDERDCMAHSLDEVFETLYGGGGR